MAETVTELAQTVGPDDAAGRLLGLPDKLVSDTGFETCAASLAAGRVATFDSVWGSSCALLVAALARRFENLLVVVPDNKALDNLLDDVATFHPASTDLPPAERFPASMQTGSSAKVAVDLEYGDRLRVIKSLNSGDAMPVIVTDIAALMQPVASRDSIAAFVKRISVGDRIGTDFQSWLTERGFHQTSAVELPGEFTSRGGIIDVFTWDWSGPVRIELFDDEVESLRQFDPATQRSIADLAQVEISVPGDDGDQSRGHLSDYLPPETVILQIEPELVAEAGKRYLERSSLPDELYGFPDVAKSWSRFAQATANRLSAGEMDSRWQMPAESVERFSGDIGEIRVQVERLALDADLIIVARVEGEISRVEEILSTTNAFQHNRIHLTTGCVHEGFRLRGTTFLPAEYELPAPKRKRRAKDFDTAREGKTAQGKSGSNGEASATGENAASSNGESTAAKMPAGKMTERPENLVVIGCDQLFHRTELRRRGRRRLGKAIDSFLDLRSGDLIIHLSHGIGRFRGLKMLDKDGQMTEHLELEFYGGTRIYVPAAKIDLVQKYIGGTKTRPVLAKIGNKNWLKQKAAAEEAVNDLASDMIELQARRSSRPGIAFAPDTQWQHEFEHSFPFRETPDQVTAIESIKNDMQQPRPMDRLLCGDVGFGKTEVAMRAAFKAVENGYQVAMLAPTTVLVEQHHRSFCERMSEFPLDIEKLSRFCTRAEQKETVARLKSGGCDIVIGTHRLASKDIDFYNLGLVIIDEEQRFGVELKERLKSIRNEVDVLTMSATPIPRTLHMSLVGVRDISNLESAPEDRVPVQTRVTRSNDELIRTAILREMNRGGQVFFVHNRVNDIHEVRQRLESIVPSAKIDVGHGQMPEGDLAKVMTRFIDGKFDVLLATTIVESGLDIPNANTIFIDEADRYGLSEMHQLRGRVGRYKHRAYCYLLLNPRKHLNPTAAKRLQAIETFSEMGAGFAISMRDLEIRGAGNLLGTQQSGHIAAVGYELYCQLLETAVRQQKQMPVKLSIQVDVDLPVAAYLPDEYIDDRRQKIDLYRRMTRLEQFDQVDELKDEMRDRFGPLPEPVERLMSLCEVKLEAALWQITGIFLQETYLGFHFSDLSRMEGLSKKQKAIRIVDDSTAFVTLKNTTIPPGKLLALVKSLLRS